MTGKRALEILDKNVNQEQLVKDLAAELVLPFIEEKLAGVDLIPGTDIDNKMIAEVIAFIKSKIL